MKGKKHTKNNAAPLYGDAGNFIAQFKNKYPHAIAHIIQEMHEKKLSQKSVGLPEHNGQLIFKKSNTGIHVEYNQKEFKPAGAANRRSRCSTTLESDAKNDSSQETLAQKGLHNPWIDKMLQTPYDNF